MSERPRVESHLREFRLSLALPAHSVAHLAGVSIGAVRRVERGEVLNMTTGTIIAVAASIGLGAGDLIPILSATGQPASLPGHDGKSPNMTRGRNKSLYKLGE